MTSVLPQAVSFAVSDKVILGVSYLDKSKFSTKFYEEFDSAPCTGYFPFTLGAKLQGNRVAEYVVLRKLGWGKDSSVWMARGCNGALVAIKVLTHISSVGIYVGARTELQVLKRFHPIRAANAHCCPPFDVFQADSVYGCHICIVFPLHSICVQEMWALLYPSGLHIPFRLIKSFVRQTLLGLRYLHSLNIVHTDVKMSNLLVCIDSKQQAVTDFLAENPTATYPPINDPSLSPEPLTIVRSQPIPPIGPEMEMNTMRICLADFGEARPIEAAGGVNVMPTALRAPEVIFDHAWGAPVDVWAVGCLAFELLTNTPVFDLEAPAGLSVTQVHLARMVELLGPFPPALHTGGRAGEFLDDVGQLRTLLPAGFRSRGSLNHILASSGWLSDREREESVAFLRRCLSTDPQSRASVAELLEDEWFHDAYCPVNHHHI